MIDLPRSKTDQEGEGRKVGIPRGKSGTTCPVRALEQWLKVTTIKTGPLLRPVSKTGRVLARALHPDSIGKLVKRAAARAGMSNIQCIAGHSLRSGFVSQAARSYSEAQLMRQTGHKTAAMVRRYIRGARIIADSPARHLDL